MLKAFELFGDFYKLFRKSYRSADLKWSTAIVSTFPEKLTAPVEDQRQSGQSAASL